MSPKRVIISLFFLAVIAVLFWWLLNPSRQKETASTSPLSSTSKVSPQSQQTAAHSPPTQPIEERHKAVVEKVLGVLATPITFYGKVIDQNGDPVPDATVNYGALDKFNASGSQYQGKSDANGNFSISGIHGAVLRAGVRKEGYYPINGKSNGAFAYGIGPDSNSKPPPTKENPAIFVLQKMGETEPLAHVSNRQFDVPKTGQPLSIDLATGQTGRGNLQLESRMGEKLGNRYDWRYKLSIPGGGLLERKEQFDFEAPSDGYQPAIEVNMPANAEQWSSYLPKQYFAKLSDGRYARFSIQFQPGARNDAGDRNMVVIESFVNPTSGSRNLEFDPTKQATP